MHLAFSTLQDLNYETPVLPSLQTTGRNISISKQVLLSLCVFNVWLAPLCPSFSFVRCYRKLQEEASSYQHFKISYHFPDFNLGQHAI